MPSVLKSLSLTQFSSVKNTENGKSCSQSSYEKRKQNFQQLREVFTKISQLSRVCRLFQLESCSDQKNVSVCVFSSENWAFVLISEIEWMRSSRYTACNRFLFELFNLMLCDNVERESESGWIRIWTVLLIAYNLPHIINSTKKHDSPKQQQNGKYVNKFLPIRSLWINRRITASNIAFAFFLALNLRESLSLASRVEDKKWQRSLRSIIQSVGIFYSMDDTFLMQKWMRKMNTQIFCS